MERAFLWYDVGTIKAQKSTTSAYACSSGNLFVPYYAPFCFFFQLHPIIWFRIYLIAYFHYFLLPILSHVTTRQMILESFI